MDLVAAWNNAQPAIKDRVGATSYETWFSSIHVKEKDHQTLLLETPDEFYKNWIVENYRSILIETLEQLHPGGVGLEFSVNAQMVKAETAGRLSQLEQEYHEPDKFHSSLNSRFTFENFVIGPANRFACAASLAVAESPAKAYNPLFVYGRVGLGKTHLIQAITHKLKQIHPKLKHSYMSSEKFTNELIDAIRHRSTNAFRKKYREIDVLLIDDIQFIAGKESTQEEFFHTFNNLHDNRKQIIITSDRSPKEIANLEERLSSRFSWGLITDIQPPNFETRVAILRKKIENESTVVPDDVIYFIAEQITSNIRELEGALIRVAAYATIEDRPISLDLAKLVLKDLVKEAARLISVEMVQKIVAKHFNVAITEIRAHRRNRNIVLPRQVAMFLSRQLTNMSLPEIGNAFGGKDHTTVLHSCKKIEKELQENRQVKQLVEELTTALKH